MFGKKDKAYSRLPHSIVYFMKKIALDCIYIYMYVNRIYLRVRQEEVRVRVTEQRRMEKAENVSPTMSDQAV